MDDNLHQLPFDYYSCAHGMSTARSHIHVGPMVADLAIGNAGLREEFEGMKGAE